MKSINNSQIQHYKCHIEKIDAVLKELLKSHIPFIEEMGNHALLGNGKRLRPLFFILCNNLCENKNRNLYHLSAIFEFFHAASLLHDDVLDNADTRRNKPSANNLWGNHASVLEGDFLVSKAFCLAIDTDNLRFLKKLTETAACMAEGQILEWIHTNDWNLSKGIYTDIIKAKSGALLSAACACGAIIANREHSVEKSLETFGLNVGIAFQLIDDILDYTSSSEVMGKPVGKDLKEGKVTLPLIYTLSKMKEKDKKKIAEIFINHQADEQDYQNLIAFVRMNGVLDGVRKEAQSYVRKAEKCLDKFPDSDIKKDLLALAQYSIDRKY